MSTTRNYQTEAIIIKKTKLGDIEISNCYEDA